MKITRTLVPFTFSLIFALALSACGTQATQPPAPEPAATQAPPTADVEPVPVTETASPEMTESPAPAPAAESATVSFANDVYPILESRCLNCHGGDSTREGLSVKTYADLMAGSDNGPVVVPGDAANSLFVELVANQKMPKRGAKLTPPQVQLFTDWVNQGALEN
ncbi:MAG: c-type cytochrome domain-containing protein [Chloroflexota bacterium]